MKFVVKITIIVIDTNNNARKHLLHCIVTEWVKPRVYLITSSRRPRTCWHRLDGNYSYVRRRCQEINSPLGGGFILTIDIIIN